MLIRNISEAALSRIDARAARLGVSRSEYLRRQIEQDADREQGDVTVADLRIAAELASDLLDEDLMRAAWS